MLIDTSSGKEEPVGGNIQGLTEFDRVIRGYGGAAPPTAYGAFIDTNLDRENVHLVDPADAQRFLQATAPPEVVRYLGLICHSQDVRWTVSHG